MQVAEHDPALTDTPAGAERESDAGQEPDETDAGPPRGRNQPERRCIATMVRQSPGGMIRFVLGPEGAIVPDLACRLPGRGAWVTCNRASVELAAKKGAFARAFRGLAAAPAGLGDIVEGLLVRRVLDRLGLARRSGDMVLGFDKVREWIRANRPAAMIEASDGAADGRNSLLALARAAHGGDAETGDLRPPVIGCFSADELGMALGRPRVIHAVVKQGRAALALMEELARLSGFRRLAPDEWGAPEPSPTALAPNRTMAGDPGGIE